MIEIYSYVTSGGDGSYSTRWVKDKEVLEAAIAFDGYGEPEMVSDSYNVYRFPDDFDFEAARFRFNDEGLKAMLKQFEEEYGDDD